MTNRRRAPIEVLERLAEAADAWYGNEDEPEPEPGWAPESKAMFEAMKSYRFATAPLRTRAEVDADIARVVRLKGPKFPHLTQELADDLARLCCEPTSGPGEGP